MKIFSQSKPCRVSEIPLSAADFHIRRGNRESLIIDNPATVAAFDELVGGGWYGKVALDVSLWSDGIPQLVARAYRGIIDSCHYDGYTSCFAWLSDDEIRLVLESCYPSTKHPNNAEAYAEAVLFEQCKRDEFFHEPP